MATTAHVSMVTQELIVKVSSKCKSDSLSVNWHRDNKNENKIKRQIVTIYQEIVSFKQYSVRDPPRCHITNICVEWYFISLD